VPKKTKPTTSETSGEPKAPSTEPKSDNAKPRRSTATAKAKKAPAKKAKKGGVKSTAKLVEPSDDEIRLRAYFISERRRRFGLSGDNSSDWIEARRQLLSEAGSP
jgi:hypothetical protein